MKRFTRPVALAAVLGLAVGGTTVATAGSASAAVSFPSASTAGAKGTLAAYTGPTTIRNNGTVIDGKQINGQLTVSAANVTIKNSRITSSSTYGILAWGKNLTVVDSTVNGKAGMVSIAGYSDQGGGDIHLTRVDASGAPDLVRMGSDGSTVQDSYFHDVCGPATCKGAHNDTVGLLPGTQGVKIIHNTILNAQSHTSAVEIGDTRSGQSSGELRDNLIAGGGYRIYAMSASGGRGFAVTGNQFSTRYFARGGYWGLVTDWKTGGGNSRSGNVWADGAKAGQTVGG